MATTATISVTPTGALVEGRVRVSLVLTNGGGSSVSILGVTPVVTPYGSNDRTSGVASGQPPIGPGNNITIAAGLALTLGWDMVGHCPVTDGHQGTMFDHYSVGANVLLSDGSTVSPTPAIFSITTNPRSQFAGIAQFNQFEASGLLAAVL